MASKSASRPSHASPAYSQIVEDVIRAGLTQADLGRAVGVSVRTAQNWVSGSATPAGVRMKRLLDVGYIVRELSETYTDEGVEIWLHSRNRNIDGESPLDLLIAGDFDRVLLEVKRISGAM